MCLIVEVEDWFVVQVLRRPVKHWASWDVHQWSAVVGHAIGYASALVGLFVVPAC